VDKIKKFEDIDHHRRFFGAAAVTIADAQGKYVHPTITGGIGHNLPREAPQAAEAVIQAGEA
jgi:hypothetical protein